MAENGTAIPEVVPMDRVGVVQSVSLVQFAGMAFADRQELRAHNAKVAMQNIMPQLLDYVMVQEREDADRVVTTTSLGVVRPEIAGSIVREIDRLRDGIREIHKTVSEDPFYSRDALVQRLDGLLRGS